MKEIRDKFKKDFKEVKHKLRKKTKSGLDKSGFFVIHIDDKDKKIVVERYSYGRKIKDKLVGNNAKLLCDTIIEKKLVSDLKHAAYLGRELEKAEIALKDGLRYKQDRQLKLT